MPQRCSYVVWRAMKVPVPHTQVPLCSVDDSEDRKPQCYQQPIIEPQQNRGDESHHPNGLKQRSRVFSLAETAHFWPLHVHTQNANTSMTYQWSQRSRTNYETASYPLSHTCHRPAHINPILLRQLFMLIMNVLRTGSEGCDLQNA